MEKYKVKLNAPIKTDQEKDGYLAVFGTIQEYSRGEAIKKAKMFNGKIEKVISNKNIFRVYIDIEVPIDAETDEHSFEELACICADEAINDRGCLDVCKVIKIDNIGANLQDFIDISLKARACLGDLVRADYASKVFQHEENVKRKIK